MESIFGLPVHPFFVHVPLVLVPTVCVGAIAVAVRPAWRRRFGARVAGATALMVITTLLAVSSGEAFDDLLNNTEPIEHHQHLAETSRLLVIGLFGAVLALTLIGRHRDRSVDAQEGRRWMSWLVALLAVFTVLAAVSSTVWIIRTGHEGTRVVWRNLSSEGDVTTKAGPASTATAASGNATPTAGPVSVTITDYSLDASGRVLKAGAIAFAVRNGENDSDHEFRGYEGKVRRASKGVEVE